ncbi:hypothetical protein [Asaia platycodi]|uniref:hypothetical protein n=1 Tax=Asaia platycodi TaxID=610243 RepID=UPI001F564027|nr:hypothetical protein [Asaia platycodi]
MKNRLSITALTTLGALCALTPAARAQYRGPISETAPLFALDTPTSYANTPFTPPVESMIPAWDRLVKKLNRKGVGIVVDYTSESAWCLMLATPAMPGMRIRSVSNLISTGPGWSAGAVSLPMP